MGLFICGCGAIGVNPARERADYGPVYPLEIVLTPMLQMIPGELASDYRVRLAVEQAHTEERRRLELLDLSATANAPDTRIRAWERTHGLTLPKAESHPVLSSIAAATRLTLDQVRNEQRRRLLPLSSQAPSPSPLPMA